MNGVYALVNSVCLFVVAVLHLLTAIGMSIRVAIGTVLSVAWGSAVTSALWRVAVGPVSVAIALWRGAAVATVLWRAAIAAWRS